MPGPQTLMAGTSFGESPRWHDGRLWFSDWGTQEVIAVDPEGKSEVIVRVPASPFCIDWLPDWRLLVVSARDLARRGRLPHRHRPRDPDHERCPPDVELEEVVGRAVQL